MTPLAVRCPGRRRRSAGAHSTCSRRPLLSLIWPAGPTAGRHAIGNDRYPRAWRPPRWTGRIYPRRRRSITEWPLTHRRPGAGAGAAGRRPKPFIARPMAKEICDGSGDDIWSFYSIGRQRREECHSSSVTGTGAVRLASSRSAGRSVLSHPLYPRPTRRSRLQCSTGFCPGGASMNERFVFNTQQKLCFV